GSASNFCRQPAPQKKKSRLSNTVRCLAVAGSTAMPQTGSRAAALDGASLDGASGGWTDAMAQDMGLPIMGRSSPPVAAGPIRRRALGALPRRGRRGHAGGLRRGLAAIEVEEIDRLDQQRQEAALAGRVGDQGAREREQQARALDQQ